MFSSARITSQKRQKIVNNNGDIDEVCILRNMDKRGRRYGFARLFNVRDDKIMETKLDNVFLEGRKLHANVPRFQRNVKVVEEKGTSVKLRR